MREIEVKARLRDEADFLAKASKLSIEFGEALEQSDTTFLDDTPYGSPAWSIFRLRKQGARTLFTMKFNASDRSRDNHEYETEVKDGDEIQKMLARLGYRADVFIHKKRRTAYYKDLELCLDEVDRLGAFVEIEKLAADDVDVDKVQIELWALLKKLGVSE
jgi:adenylate cyclase class 2